MNVKELEVVKVSRFGEKISMPKEIILEPLKVLMGGFNKQVRFRAKTQGDRVNSTSEDNNRK